MYWNLGYRKSHDCIENWGTERPKIVLQTDSYIDNWDTERFDKYWDIESHDYVENLSIGRSINVCFQNWGIESATICVENLGIGRVTIWLKI